MRRIDGKRGIAMRAIAALAVTGVVTSATAVSAHADTSWAGVKAAALSASQRLSGDGALFYNRTNTVNGSAVYSLQGVDSHGVQTTGLGYASQMSWSPDGSKVAIADADGITVWDAAFTHPTPLPAPAGTDPKNMTNPRWLADGSAIAYVETAAGGSNLTLWTVRPDGTGAAQVALPHAEAASYIASFDVTPDGGYVFNDTTIATPAFVEWHPGDASVTPLIPGTVDYFAVSPDGSRIAYRTFTAGAKEPSPFQLYTVASKQSTTLRDGKEDGPYPVWSPDGTKVAYQVRDTFDGPSITSTHVVVQDVVSGTVTDAVPHADGQYAEPVGWRPVTPPPAPPAPPAGPGQEDRVGGGDRIATSVATSQLGFSVVGTHGRQAESAVLSRSDTFADALAGSALAAQKKGPLLLTGTGSLDPQVAAELKRTLPAHATVYLLGGTSALSDKVLDQVAALGFTPHRVAGGDRFSTAVEIAKAITATPTTFLVATGRNYPDALAAGAMAGAQKNTVVVLSDDNALPQATKDYLTANRVSGAKLIGVGVQGSTALDAVFGKAVITAELRGRDRFDTATRLAKDFYAGKGAAATVGVATGYAWPDALSGGAFLGAHPGPLLLTDGAALSADESAFLTANAAAVKEVVVFGGPQAVGPAAADSVANTAFGPGKWTYHLNRVAPVLP